MESPKGIEGPILLSGGDSAPRNLTRVLPYPGLNLTVVFQHRLYRGSGLGSQGRCHASGRETDEGVSLAESCLAHEDSPASDMRPHTEGGGVPGEPPHPHPKAWNSYSRQKWAHTV